MDKVQCKVCGKTGWTAAVDYLICKCGGRFKVILADGKKQKVVLTLDEDTFRLYDTSDIINILRKYESR